MRRWGPRGAGLAAGALALALAALRPEARAEEAQRSISFATARAAAEAAAPEVDLARGRTAIARADIDVAAALANPALTVTTALKTARLGVGVGVPVPLFGQRGTAIEAARSDAETARLEVETARAEARFAASVAWLDLWEAQEEARFLGEAARESGRVAEIAAEKFTAGTAPRVDVLRTTADAARARADAAFAAANVPAAAARLAIAIGGEYDAGLVADGGPGLAFADTDFAALEQRLGDHPTLRRDRAQVAASMARVRHEQRLRWPTVTADLTLNWNDPSLPGNDLIGGVSFEPPVLSLRGGAIARARAEQALAETTAALDARRLHAALVDAFGRAAGAGARAHALATEVLPGIEEVRHMTEEGYRDGRVDLLRLLDAQRAWLDSRLAEVQAEATWQRALAEIERAAGVTLEKRPTDAR